MPASKPPKRHQDRRVLDTVLAHPRWADLRDDDVSAMIDEGAFKLVGFRALDRLLAALEDRGLSVDDVTVEILHGLSSEVRIRGSSELRKALKHLCEPSPLSLALDQMSSKLYAAFREKRPKGPDRRKERPRRFSVAESELPEAWQRALADTRAGLPGEDAAAPAPSVTDTLAQKICGLIKVARDAGLPDAVTLETAIAYERSLLERERPLAQATIHSSMKHVCHFAKYLGLEQDVVDHLSERVRIHERKLTQRTSVKAVRAAKLLDYGEILGLGLEMLSLAEDKDNPRIAQKLRNSAVALVLFCPFPLRVADTRLRFGETLLWTGETYQIFIPDTSKRGDPFSAVLSPFFRSFIDALVLRGLPATYLEQMQVKCFAEKRLLFVNSNGSAPHDRYVSYVWKTVLGTGSHITRTKIHDTLAQLGPRGVELAMAACTHTSRQTAEYYRSIAFDMLAQNHVHSTLEATITEEEWREYFDDPDTGKG